MEVMMDWTCSSYGKPLGMLLLGRLEGSWEDDIKMDLKE
jgi:hypothetical protein